MTSQFQLWKDRAQRVHARSLLAANDIRRAFNWYVMNDRVHYKQHSQNIINDHKWCFIVGCNNSGTSLVQRILEQSGQISTFPFEGQRYTRTLTRAYKRGYERVWSEYLKDLRLTQEDSKACVPRLVHDWVESMKSPLRGIIVEKTTANAVRMTWLQEVFPNSYFIGIVRNGYAVTEGIRRKGGKSVERGARHWDLVNKIMINDAKSVANYLEVHYEDIAERKPDSIQKLAKFIDLDSKHFNLETSRGQTIRNFNHESIQRLSRDDIETIRSIAGEMLEYHGYSALVEGV